MRVEDYGYTLRKALADIGLEIEESTLYPLLPRLDSRGLLPSEWREEDASRDAGPEPMAAGRSQMGDNTGARGHNRHAIACCPFVEME